MKMRNRGAANEIFMNYDEILQGHDRKTKKLREDALTILADAVKAADPRRIMRERVKFDGKTLTVHGVINGEIASIDVRGEVKVVAFGKASLAMTKAFGEIVHIDEGIVVLPRSDKREKQEKQEKQKKQERRRKNEGIEGNVEIIEASHPFPDENSVLAAEKALEIARGCDADDLFVALISGGGSSLLAKPSDGISLEDKIAVTRALLKSGCTVRELNIVRKKISAVKGGKLAAAAHPATTLALILSDVVGDDVDVIASGPTVEDKSTFKQAKSVLESVWNEIPESVKRFILRGLEGEERAEKSGMHAGKAERRKTVKGQVEGAEDARSEKAGLKRVHNIVIGNNLIAARAAEASARELGYNTLLLTTHLEGESREVAKVFTAVAMDILRYRSPLKTPTAIIAGGETTVTVVGNGKGGRNQEFVLSAAICLEDIIPLIELSAGESEENEELTARTGQDAEKNAHAGQKAHAEREAQIVIASIGTDGIDGMSDAAGAIADRFTIERARKAGLDPVFFLRNNDSNTFFRMLNDALLTGRTGTNVNDIAVVLVA